MKVADVPEVSESHAALTRCANQYLATSTETVEGVVQLVTLVQDLLLLPTATDGVLLRLPSVFGQVEIPSGGEVHGVSHLHAELLGLSSHTLG